MSISFKISLLLLFLTFNSGCLGQPEAQEKSHTQVHSNPLLQSLLIQKGPEHSLNEACTADTDCQRPLRCIEALCSIPPGVLGKPKGPKIDFLDQNQKIVASIFVEIADDRFEQAQGLMWRRMLLPDWGMIFIFKDLKMRSFWMHNTYIPLDMIFVSKDKKIINIAEMTTPLRDRPTYQSLAPAAYVIEVNGGFSKKFGLHKNMSIHFENF